MGDYYRQWIRVTDVPGPPEPPLNAAEAADYVDPYEALADELTDWSWVMDFDPWSIQGAVWSAKQVKEAIEADALFTVDEGRPDEIEAIGGVLTEHGFSWYGVLEPNYEYPGTLYAYTPELGEFSESCDVEGNVHILPSALERMVDESTDLDDFRERLAKATGKAWFPKENANA